MEENDFPDHLWVVYNSATSVGFGDGHIQHSNVTWGHAAMFILLVILGFIYVATFVLKFSEMVQSWIPDTNKSFANILKDSRENDLANTNNNNDKQSK